MFERHGLTLGVAFLVACVTSAPLAAAEPEQAQPVTVYKSPSCGCCAKWVEYLAADGFDVTTVERADVQPIKQAHGVPPRLQSCHTAVIDGYVIEGHVPARDIRRLLNERPNVIGLSAPGMPPMSPGMGSIEPRDYDVLSFDGDGGVAVYSRY